MATDLTQESVLRFLLKNGGVVRNVDLINHYRRFLREDEEREQNRELFKKYVNSVATVKQKNGVSYVVLRQKYHVHLGDVANNVDLDRDPNPGVSKHQECGPALAIPVPVAQGEILPASDIITTTKNNNDCTGSLETAVTTLPHGSVLPVISINGTCGFKPAPPDPDSLSSGSGQSFDQPRESKASQEATGLEHSDVYPAKQRQLGEADGCEQSFVKPMHCEYYEVRASPTPEKPHLYINSDINTYKQYKKQSEDPVAKVWPLHAPLGQSLKSTSTPCLLDVPVASHVHSSLYTQEGLSQSNDCLLQPHGRIKGFPKQQHEEFVEATDVPNPHVSQNAPPAHIQLRHPTIVTPSYDSHSTPFASSHVSDTGWSQGFGREEWPRDYGLKYQELAVQDGNDVHAFIRHSQEARLLSQLHQPSHNVKPFHCSTGHLVDKAAMASPHSISPKTHYEPVAQKLSSHLQSRICRSLGEDLDQPFPEETISGRHNRLQLLSSTLSMSNLVPAPSSRGLGSRDLSSLAGSTRNLRTYGHDGSFSSRQSSVPLDPTEHEWFVKAASGEWTDIYALFRDDPNLLTKQDFISGFTILHWIAKHGDHRVLNTLWYGVEKAGMTLDVDAKNVCGYTPLHLAAIHGHKQLILLLVQMFKANVRIRDNSGKRPWQYLSKDENQEIFKLLKAPPRIISGSPATQGSTEKLTTRPAATRVNVKRHSSLAALFKHKSHLRVSRSPEAV